MQFHDLAASEASSLIARLLAAQSESSLQHLRTVRAALDATVQALEVASTQQSDEDVQQLVVKLTTAFELEGQRAADELRRVSEEGRRRLEEANAALSMQVDENGRLASAIARSDAERALLKTELDTTQERADAAERDLSATVEAHAEIERILKATDAELRHAVHARTQAESELIAARANVQRSGHEFETLRQELQRANSESLHLRQLLEQANAEGRELGEALSRATADGLEFREALAQSTADGDELRAAFDRLTAHEEELRERLEHAEAERTELARQLSAATASATDSQVLARELETANGRVQALESELNGQRELTSSELEAASGRIRVVEASLADAQAVIMERDSLVTELGISRARTLTLEAQQGEHAEQIRQLQVRLDDALQAEAKLRESLARASDVRPDEEQTETLRWELERMVSLFDASVRAVNEMTSMRTSGDLLAELVKRLSIQFSRVALFRLKGHGLEAEHHVGFEDTDISSLVLPVTADSLLTKAIASGTAESLAGENLGNRLGTPFGGCPTSAVALPIILQGTTLAVVYADDADMPDYARGPAVHESSVGFAKLLVGEAAVLLMCHTHELKTLNELRQYATTLLQEAKEMYLADAEAGKSPTQLRGRLKDNLDCASQLYTYRAAMEGTAAASLLDEQIAAEMTGSSAFSRDLSEVVNNMSKVELGITAEAS